MPISFIISKWDTHIGLNSFHTHKNTNYSTQIKFNSTKILINLQNLQGDPFYPIKIQNISIPNSLLKIYSETNFAKLSLQYHYSSLQIQLSKSLSGHWKNGACLRLRLSNSLPSSPEGRLKKYVPMSQQKWLN